MKGTTVRGRLLRLGHRRAALAALVAVGAALALSACGEDGDGDLPPEAAEGRMVFQAEGCGSCHMLEAAGTEGTIGPNLDEALKGRDRQFIRTAIVDPEASIAEGFPSGVMPANYAQRLEPAELDLLVQFLFETAAQK